MIRKVLYKHINFTYLLKDLLNFTRLRLQQEMGSLVLISRWKGVVKTYFVAGGEKQLHLYRMLLLSRAHA